MDRTACVDLPALPLQLLLRQHPDWRGYPVAVVDSDRPQGVVLWINEQARAARILNGMRFATALSLSADLRAASVPQARIARAVRAIARRLRRHTPAVEPARDEPGVFWLDASGLEQLYGSLASWAQGIAADLAAHGLDATLVVGFRRFATYAVAKSGHGVTVLRGPQEEQTTLESVPLQRLAIESRMRDTLAKLGVLTIGQLLELPAEGVRQRYGQAAFDLHRMAAGELNPPLRPERVLPPVTARLILDQAETDAERLVYRIEQRLPTLLDELAERGEALDALQVVFRFERLGSHAERIRPAAPTRDARQIMELLRLRLSVTHLPDGVEELRLLVRTAKPERRQLTLGAERPRRDLEAANLALARVRAELGDHSVVRACLRAGHLPENHFAWEPLSQLTPACSRVPHRPRLVRRLYRRPVPLPPRPRHEPDGWMLRGLEQGPVVRVFGPYIIAGGWWVRPVHREYHFAETQKGEILWVFYDRVRRRWFVHGRVE